MDNFQWIFTFLRNLLPEGAILLTPLAMTKDKLTQYILPKLNILFISLFFEHHLHLPFIAHLILSISTNLFTIMFILFNLMKFQNYDSTINKANLRRINTIN